MSNDRESLDESRMRLHVSHGQLNDTGTHDAIQGELFLSTDEDAPTCGYRGIVASKVAGITYRQLDYWARKRILEPSITPSHGSGSRRLYSFKDIVVLAASKKLLDAGVNLQNVTTAIEFLMQRSCAQLEHVTIVCDGQEVHECADSEMMLELLLSGKAVFAVSIGSLWHEIQAMLEQEESVEVDPQTGVVMANSPIDELAAMRLRRKIESQHVQRALI